MRMEIRRVGVVGAGTMGNGIAHVFARSGYDVVLCDVEQRFLERGDGNDHQESGARSCEKQDYRCGQRCGAGANSSGNWIATQLAECDFVVEAATEKFEIKTEIFRDLDRLTRPESHPGFEHFFHLDHQARRADETAGKSDRHALLQSRTGDEVGGSDSRAGHFAGALSTRYANLR